MAFWWSRVCDGPVMMEVVKRAVVKERSGMPEPARHFDYLSSQQRQRVRWQWALDLMSCHVSRT